MGLSENGAIENIIKEGTNLALSLIKLSEESDVDNNEEIIETTETIEEYVDVVEMPRYGYSYWEPYYDPFYISPLWMIALVI